jgi:hypothetical protein
MAAAMESAVKLAELIKHRVKGVYQLNNIETQSVVDEYEPLEEGLDHLKFERKVTMITIQLSKAPLDRQAAGHQDPIPDDEVQEYNEREDRPPREGGERSQSRRGGRGGLRRGFRGGFRGGRGGRGAPRPRTEGPNDRGYNRDNQRSDRPPR